MSFDGVLFRNNTDRSLQPCGPGCLSPKIGPHITMLIVYVYPHIKRAKKRLTISIAFIWIWELQLQRAMKCSTHINSCIFVYPPPVRFIYWTKTVGGGKIISPPYTTPSLFLWASPNTESFVGRVHLWTVPRLSIYIETSRKYTFKHASISRLEVTQTVATPVCIPLPGVKIRSVGVETLSLPSYIFYNFI